MIFRFNEPILKKFERVDKFSLELQHSYVICFLIQFHVNCVIELLVQKDAIAFLLSGKLKFPIDRLINLIPLVRGFISRRSSFLCN